jgi:hypothetical protein
MNGKVAMVKFFDTGKKGPGIQWAARSSSEDSTGCVEGMERRKR